MKKFHFLLLASAVLLPALPAHAQDEATPAGDDGELIVVASGVEQRVEDTGRSITVIDRSLIEQRQVAVLSDLLATTPGVSFSRNGGVGTFTGVRVRGAEAEQTLVLIDGVRVNDPSAPGGGFDFGNLLTSAVERVEVLRGPNSVIWGSQAIGGVVNVVTEGGELGLHGRAQAEYGYADTLSTSAAISGGTESIQGALTGGYYRTDGISAAAVGTEPDGYRQYGATGRLRVEFAPGFSADLRGYFADSRTDLDGFPPPSFSFADTLEYSTARELYGYAGLNGEFFGGAFKNRVSVSLSDIDRDNFDLPASAAPAFFAHGSAERYEYRGDINPARWVRAVVGAEHEKSRFTDGARESTDITSVYGQLIVTPIDALTVTGGVRYDDHQRFGSNTTLAASAAWRPTDTTTLRASYAEGFKAPTLYQLFSFFGDINLQPETAKSYEVGAEQSFLGGRVRVGAAWFHRDVDNQIDFDLITFSYKNIVATRASGVEVELTLKPVEAFTVQANYTHVDSENRTPGAVFGNDLARRPRDILSLAADYRFPFGLQVGGSLLMVGDSFDNAGNSVRLDGYALVGLRAEMPINDMIAVYGRVDNLFDEQYQTVAGYGTLGRAAYGGVRLRFN